MIASGISLFIGVILLSIFLNKSPEDKGLIVVEISRALSIVDPEYNNNEPITRKRATT